MASLLDIFSMYCQAYINDLATRLDQNILFTEKDMDIEKDQAAMLPSGDFDKLDKREREEFHAMQERMVQFLIRASNEFQLQYPNLDIKWRFQAEVYQTVQANPSTVRYSQRIY